MTFAIITTGGKQYRVAEGDKLEIEKLLIPEGGEVVFDKVLLISRGEEVKVGAPTVAGAKVHGKVLAQFRGEKKIVFKYHSKTRRRKMKGHRQPLTRVQITKV